MEGDFPNMWADRQAGGLPTSPHVGGVAMGQRLPSLVWLVNFVDCESSCADEGFPPPGLEYWEGYVAF